MLSSQSKTFFLELASVLVAAVEDKTLKEDTANDGRPVAPTGPRITTTPEPATGPALAEQTPRKSSASSSQPHEGARSKPTGTGKRKEYEGKGYVEELAGRDEPFKKERKSGRNVEKPRSLDEKRSAPDAARRSVFDGVVIRKQKDGTTPGVSQAHTSDNEVEVIEVEKQPLFPLKGSSPIGGKNPCTNCLVARVLCKGPPAGKKNVRRCVRCVTKKAKCVAPKIGAWKRSTTPSLGNGGESESEGDTTESRQELRIEVREIKERLSRMEELLTRMRH